MKKKGCQGGVVVTHPPRLWGCESRVNGGVSSGFKVAASIVEGLKAAREKKRKSGSFLAPNVTAKRVWGYIVLVFRGGQRVYGNSGSEGRSK